MRGFSLKALLLWGPIVGLVIALTAWVQTLREQVFSLEQRVATLELNQPLVGMLPTSTVGVPLEVDEAMMLDSVPGASGMQRR